MSKRTAEQLYEDQERALVTDAIQETEQEIFDDALGDEPADNDGDRSLEEMDEDEFPGEDGAEDDAIDDEAEADGDGADEGEGTEDDGEPPPDRQDPADRQDGRRGVPPGRLREEAEQRRVAEAEREQARAEARELRARLEALERGQQQPRRQAQDGPDPNAPPDLFADPEGRLNWERQQISQQFEERRINSSFEDARLQAGDETFVAAFQALQRAGNPNLVREIVGSNNPGRALMDWHGRQALMSEIGNDPAAYRERVRQELLNDPETRRAVITNARGDALRGDGGRPRTQTRLPPSLNSATGGTSHRGDIAPRGRGGGARSNRSIEQEIFESAFDD